MRIFAPFAIVAAIFAMAVGLAALATDQPLAEAPVTGTEQARPAPARPRANEGADAWHKRWWIEKTSKLLRAGEGLAPHEDIERLERLSEEEIVREFMRDERFGDTVLDFNMYFLGFKVDSIKVDGQYVHSAYDFANAINSAKALLENGDYLKLFDLEGDYYMAPLSVAPSEELSGSADGKLPPKQLRQKAIDELRSRFEDLLDLRIGKKPAGADVLCEEIEELTDAREKLTWQLFRAFTDMEIFVLVRGSVPETAFNMLQADLDKECENPTGKELAERLKERIRTVSAQLKRAFDEISKFEPSLYGPDSLAEFKPLDHAAFPAGKKWPVFGFEQGSALANSSTNYNRKRSAYVLKRFFCDDLNPVGFDDPKQHVGGAHGTQTSCYSCHYKLDPMAGFFRNYGALFSDSSSSPDIVFDDLASMNRKTYLKSWRAAEESGRKWDVGYIRSPRWTEKNSYGESLDDLSKIIRDAPEAKRCLMKRLTEYMLGEKQTVDGGYLDHLTKNFEAEARENSSVAFKNAMVRILQSDTYGIRNPDPRQCYDLAPGAKAENRPPCRVAYILEKNCVECHDGKDILNTLDLSKWIAAPDGHRRTFEHLTDDGEQLSAAQTLQKISRRLSSTDPKIRMPKNKPMSSQERQELYLWAQKELSGREANSR